MLKAVEISILTLINRSIYGAHMHFSPLLEKWNYIIYRKNTKIECNIFNKLKLEHLMAWWTLGSLGISLKKLQGS